MTNCNTTVIIPAFSLQRIELLKSGVKAVLANTRLADEIILSIDSNPELAARLQDEYRDIEILRIIESDGKGASCARNSGVSISEGDVIAFLDDDARPSQDWLERLITPFENSEEVVAVGGRLLPDYESDSRVIPGELLWLVGCTYIGHRQDEGPISRPIGANMAIRRSALDAVGGFSDAYGPNGEVRVNSNEELMMSQHLRSIYGSECIWYVPQSVAHHWVSDERIGLRYIVRRSVVEGRSKAEIRRDHGAVAMGHDRSYLTRTFIPGMARYISHRRYQEASLLVLSVSCTGAAFVARRVRHLLDR